MDPKKSNNLSALKLKNLKIKHHAYKQIISNFHINWRLSDNDWIDGVYIRSKILNDWSGVITIHLKLSYDFLIALLEKLHGQI
jgi:hypothetical protein